MLCRPLVRPLSAQAASRNKTPCAGGGTVWLGLTICSQVQKDAFGAPSDKGQADPAVLAALLLDLADLDPTDFCGAGDMGAAAGLQVDLV